MIYLAIPPGWTLHPGGPHIALPLLKGYLEGRDVEVTVRDLNIETANYFKAQIEENDVVNAIANQSIDALNSVYFGSEDRLAAVAKQFGGKWFAHEGYQHLECDLGNPESVRDVSLYRSPFTEYFNNEVIPTILRANPKIVGLSIYVPSQVLTAFEFSRLLRSHGYDGFIVFGGNHITRIAQDMRLDWVFDIIDGIVTYQGEKTLYDLHSTLSRSGDLAAVPNLIWRKDGYIIENERALLKVPEFARPNFDGIQADSYWGTKYLPMIGARGCFYGKCSFCAIPYGWGPKNYIGRSQGAEVVSWMNDAFEHQGTNRFKFVDEALHPRMLREMVAAKSEFSTDFQFEGYVRFDTNWTDVKFLNSCGDIGLRKAYLGLELAPSENRVVLAKADHADPLVVLKKMKDAGIKTHIFCLFGYPGTGVDEAIRTAEFAFNNADLIDTLDIFPFYYARHTNVQGVKVVDEPSRPWRTEHKYAPDAENVLWPEEVEVLAGRMNDIAWQERPYWSHPIYRMFSPWHDTDSIQFENWKLVPGKRKTAALPA
ncbi:hypothetical protein QA648_34745 (plasmid) [Rhizobium sp. CB3171]|uniref:B12-binding domain-containing radical SAM protein n=1 Tax=Rhizobium sp. CB3171 TaxID=3039157 RepID=UPI0024B13F26|nr:hypothetical protein [Rhizobium sp. CB3171]WFU07244.1 hypothetical protein QA648_34745 [Rhizobium sp. CB3171]